MTQAAHNLRKSDPISLARRRLSAPQWLIVSGGCVFILVLIVSAVFEPDIRWLHFFQSWMYVATIALTLRGSTWGHFVGVSVAGLWDYTNLFVTNFLGGGVGRFMVWIQTGHLSHAPQLIAIPAWLANLLVVIGCAWAYSRQANKSRRDLAKFAIAFAFSTGFFLADIALFQPRYLSLFPRMLHPHQPMIK
jgi:hypothetical protein